MSDLTGYGRLAQFSKLTDRMISEASKDAIALVAQVLAIQVGHYQRKFGVIPIDEAIDLLEAGLFAFWGSNNEKSGSGYLVVEFPGSRRATLHSTRYSTLKSLRSDRKIGHI